MWTQLFQMLQIFFSCFIGSIRTTSFPQPLTAEEEQDALQRMAKGDVEARADLIEHNLRLVAHIVKKFDIRREQTEDLISIGTIGLIKGIDTFKVDKGHKLATYVTLCIVCYPLADAFMVPNQYPQSRKELKWHILAQVSEKIYILCSAFDGCVRYAPRYILKIFPMYRTGSVGPLLHETDTKESCSTDWYPPWMITIVSYIKGRVK